jgi:hypothetical protein
VASSDADGAAPKQPGKVSRYLGSTKNLTGGALAAGGLALAITGVIGLPVWPFVVGALYGIGALVAPPGRPKDLAGGGAFDPEQITDSLVKLRKETRGRVPDDIAAKVERIAVAIETILPKAGKLSGSSRYLFALERTATDYLPTTVHAYLDLPRQYADTRVIQDGKTAHQIVSEQLDILVSQMDEVVDAANRGDVDRLLAQGRFLDERFGKQALTIEGPAVGDIGGSSSPPITQV